MAIGFNAQYLMDFIKATGSGEVKLELKRMRSRPGQPPSRGSEDYKYRYIVMPEEDLRTDGESQATNCLA